MLVVSIRIVPAEVLLDAAALHELPPLDVVEHEMIVLPAVQVGEDVDGVTLIRSHVIFEPAYDQIVILGLQAVGAIVAGRAFNVACCSLPPGVFQIAAPLFPPTL